MSNSNLPNELARPDERFEFYHSTDREKWTHSLNLLFSLRSFEDRIAEIAKTTARPYVLGDSALTELCPEREPNDVRADANLLSDAGLVFRLDLPFKLAGLSEQHEMQSRTSGWGRFYLDRHRLNYQPQLPASGSDALLRRVTESRDFYEMIVKMLFEAAITTTQLQRIRDLNGLVPIPLSK